VYDVPDGSIFSDLKTLNLDFKVTGLS